VPESGYGDRQAERMTSSRQVVMMGDLVRSTKAERPEVEAAMASLRDGIAALGAWHGADPRFTRYRGDGWQCLLARPPLALRSALYLKAWLAAEDALQSRVVFAAGPVDNAGTADLSDADGPAFHMAGRLLDALPRNRRLAVAPVPGLPLAPALVALCDALSLGWTKAQGAAVLRALAPEPPSQQIIAEALAITQQSVFNRLDAARFWAIETAVEAYETAGSEQASTPVSHNTGA